MARTASPWYWAERGAGTSVAGRREPLGTHPGDAPAPKKIAKTGKWNAPREIEEAFHRLMTGEKEPAPRPSPTGRPTLQGDEQGDSGDAGAGYPCV